MPTIRTVMKRAKSMCHLVLMTAIAGVVACCGEDQQVRKNTDSNKIEGITLSDAFGTTVTLPKPAQRVISFAPNLTEILFFIGADSQIIARTDHCDFPSKASSVHSIGSMGTFDYESILALNPDLILMTFAGNSETGYNKARDLGLRPFALEAATVHGVINSIDTVGMLLGLEEATGKKTSALRSRVDSLVKLVSSEEPVTFFIVINKAPLMTVSKGFIDEALQLLKGKNIAAGTIEAYPHYSREELLRRDPEVIIVPAKSEEDIQELLQQYPEWRDLQAVKKKRIHVIDPDILLRPGPRIVESLEQLHPLLHNE